MLKQFFRLLILGWLLALFSLFLAQRIGDIQTPAYLAFLSERNRSIDIVLADSNAGLNMTITNNSNREAELFWSKDGRYLSYRIADVPDTIIWLFDSVDGSMESLDLGEYSFYAWYSANELFIHTRRTSTNRLLNIETGTESSYIEACPEWNCLPNSGISMSAYDLDLSIINGEMNVVINRQAYLSEINEPNVELQPWSPEMQAFLFISALQGQPDIYLSPAEGGIARRLTNSPTPEQEPRWSADGQKISFVSYETGNPEIVILELATGRQYNISRHPHRDDTPVWQPLP